MKATAMRWLLWLTHHVPPAAAKTISHGVGWLLWRVGSDSARTTSVNLRLCFPDRSDQEQHNLTRASLTHMCLLFFEFAYLAFTDPDELLANVTAIDGKELLDSAYAQGRGVVLLVPHFGNWELLCSFLGAHFTFAALYDPPKIASLEGVIREVRERFNGQMFPISTGGMRSLMRVLKDGKLVAVLPDQVPDREAGVYVEFFGNTALTMTLTHRLVEKTGAMPIMGSVQRVFADGALTYYIRFEPLPEIATDAESPAAGIATSVNSAIETVICRAPEQYQWEYKRFKRPPQRGKNNVYRRQ